MDTLAGLPCPDTAPRAEPLGLRPCEIYLPQLWILSQQRFRSWHLLRPSPYRPHRWILALGRDTHARWSRDVTNVPASQLCGPQKPGDFFLLSASLPCCTSVRTTGPLRDGNGHKKQNEVFTIFQANACEPTAFKAAFRSSMRTRRMKIKTTMISSGAVPWMHGAKID